jgi:hypothetical protein
MSRHRLEPARPVRPRVGRMVAAALSLTVTVVALLGFVGLIPMDPGADGDRAAVASSQADDGKAEAAGSTAAGAAAGQPVTGTSRSEEARTVSGTSGKIAASQGSQGSTALPAASGSGRRVVFSKSAQRVWLVDAQGTVDATYLVSGSVTNNLGPGKYDVYSKSRWAVGIDDSGVMQYFVRFAHGANAAIGFHSIPTKNGVPLQTEAQLGTPQSHGCIRQKLSDAERLWNFAGVGTDVVVLA